MLLKGFNHLVKTLYVSFYQLEQTADPKAAPAMLSSMDARYSPAQLAPFLTATAERVGARVLNLAQQAYQPHGASTCLLIEDGQLPFEQLHREHRVLAHLDKSHLNVHTYLESTAHGLATFRADVELSTCGDISPLHTLGAMMDFFPDDVVIIDYQVRGMTRGQAGERQYCDHAFNTLLDWIPDTRRRYYQHRQINHHELLYWQLRLRNRHADKSTAVQQECTGLFQQR